MQHYRAAFPTARRRRAGFTLVELMMALFVFVFGILGVFSLLLSSLRTDRQAQVQAAAYNVARQQIETLTAQKYANRPATASPQSFPIPANVAAQFPDLTLTGSYTISTVAAYGGAAYPVQQIAVQVQWNNIAAASGSPVSSVRLDTLRAQEPGK